MAGEKVLLVDDELEFTRALSERMQSRGVEVDTAADGQEALAKVKDRIYDVIILDLQMPGMDGIEVLKKLIEGNPVRQVILLTGHATVEKGVEAVKLGAADFLEKPVDIKTLMEKIVTAKAKKMLLVEEKSEGSIRDLLKDKWW
jgi:DNA-binding NtrC family response regulator